MLHFYVVCIYIHHANTVSAVCHTHGSIFQTRHFGRRNKEKLSHVRLPSPTTSHPPPSFSAQYYVKVMKKVQDKGDEFIQTEQERLGRILSKWSTMYYCESL